MRRRHWHRVLAALAVVITAGCTSATDGFGSGRSAAVTSGGVSSGPSSETSPSSPTTLPSASLPGTTTPPVAPPCPAGVDFCDRFDDPSSGWPVASTKRFFAEYSPALGGSYRVGERTAKAKTWTAPYDVTTVSTGYGTRVEADAVLGVGAPTTSYLGLGCWGHDVGSGTQAGFLFFVTERTVDVTLLDDTDGALHTLAQNTGGGFVQPYPAVTHLAATCELGRNAKGVRQAELTLAINGETVLQTTYARSVTNQSWSPGPRTSLLVAGAGSVGYYDNVEITGL